MLRVAGNIRTFTLLKSNILNTLRSADCIHFSHFCKYNWPQHFVSWNVYLCSGKTSLGLRLVFWHKPGLEETNNCVLTSSTYNCRQVYYMISVFYLPSRKYTLLYCYFFHFSNHI